MTSLEEKGLKEIINKCYFLIRIQQNTLYLPHIIKNIE